MSKSEHQPGMWLTLFFFFQGLNIGDLTVLTSLRRMQNSVEILGAGEGGYAAGLGDSCAITRDPTPPLLLTYRKRKLSSESERPRHLQRGLRTREGPSTSRLF